MLLQQDSHRTAGWVALCLLKPTLVDSHNHTYNMNAKLKRWVKWQCCLRNKDTYCMATVEQSGDIFTKGPLAHSCTPKAATLPVAKARSQIARESVDISSSLHHRLWIRLFSTTSQVMPLLSPFPSSQVRHWSTRLTSGIRALALPTLQHWTLRYRKTLCHQTSWRMTSASRTVDISTSSHHWCWPGQRSGTWTPPSRVSANPSSSCGPFTHSSDRETAWNRYHLLTSSWVGVQKRITLWYWGVSKAIPITTFPHYCCVRFWACSMERHEDGLS